MHNFQSADKRFSSVTQIPIATQIGLPTKRRYAETLISHWLKKRNGAILGAACAGRLRAAGDRLIETTLLGGVPPSANSGGIGVGRHDAAAVRIFRATPWIAFASSWVCKLSLPNSCAATVSRFTSSFALVELDRSAATLWRIAASDFVSSPSMRARVAENDRALAAVASRCDAPRLRTRSSWPRAAAQDQRRRTALSVPRL